MKHDEWMFALAGLLMGVGVMFVTYPIFRAIGWLP